MNGTAPAVERTQREAFGRIYSDSPGSSRLAATVVRPEEGVTLIAVVAETVPYVNKITTQEVRELAADVWQVPAYEGFVTFSVHDDGGTLLVDLEGQDPLWDLDQDYRRVVTELWEGGRPMVADEVVEMLRSKDPDLPEIQLFSLEAMARFLVREKQFEDPMVGPDSYGIMQAEWHIVGNGLLVMAFVEQDVVHCVAQSDATPGLEALNASVRLHMNKAIQEFGQFVPERSLPGFGSLRPAFRHG